jgi:SAM-dependent methyltransferase
MHTRVDANLVSPEARFLYEGYYEGISQWRSAGATGKADHIVDLCQGIKVQRALEVGAGEGSVLAELGRRGFAEELHAVEISKSGVDAIQRRKIDCVQGVDLFDGYHLPYPDKSFDLAFATHVLEHVEHERLFLREIARAARYVLIEVPLESRPLRTLPVVNQIGHINFYNTHGITALLETTGLKVIRSRVYDHGSGVSRQLSPGLRGWLKIPARRMMLRVMPTLATAVFVYHYALLCQPLGAVEGAALSPDCWNGNQPEPSNVMAAP